MKALVLSAGYGTRLKPITDFMPKPVVPLLGVPIGLWVCGLLRDMGVGPFVLNTHHLADQVKQLVQTTWLKNSTEISHEDEKPLESGGGVWFAKRYLEDEENFIVANGDEVILLESAVELQKIWQQHVQANRLCTITTIVHPEVGSKFGGVWVNGKNHVLGFGKKPIDGATRGHHNIGIYFFSRRIFSYIKPCVSNLLYDAVTGAIRQGEAVEASPTTCQWFESGHLSDFPVVAQQLLDLVADPSSRYHTRIMNLIRSYDPLMKWTGPVLARESVARLVQAEAPCLIGGQITLEEKPERPIRVTRPTIIDGRGVVSKSSFANCLTKGGFHFLMTDHRFL